MKNILIFLCFFFSSIGCWSGLSAQSPKLQDISFKNYTPAAGLPSDFIEAITQDRYGFLWLGTHNGLVRYDGSHFSLYHCDPKDSGSLYGNEFRSVAADPTGKCWVASRNGLFYFDYAINAFRHKCIFAGHAIQWASGLAIDSGSNLWFLSNAGIGLLNCRSGLEMLIPLPESASTRYSENDFYCTFPGTVWFFYNALLFKLDKKTLRFQSFTLDSVIFKKLAQGIFAVYETAGEALWIASYAGFYRLGLTSHQITKIPFSFRGIYDPDISISGFNLCPALTGDTVLWCSTPYQGLVLFNLHTLRFTGQFLQNAYDATSIGGSLCYKSFLDHSGILWIAQFNGLSKLDWRDQRIKAYRISQMVDSNRLMPIRKILQALGDATHLWLITWNFGALYYDQTNHRVITRYIKTKGKDRIDISALYDAVFDAKNILWVGSEQGLCYFDNRTKQFIHCPLDAMSDNNPLVVSRILAVGKNQLLLGTESGLWVFYPEKKTYLNYPFSNESDSMLKHLSVYALCFDRKGRLYMGTRKGLYVIDTTTHRCEAMIRTPPATGDFDINYIWGIVADTQNRIWVTTRGGGLYNYDPATKKYHDYPMGHGLSTDELRDVFVDSLQRIWMSSYDGIFMLDPLSGQFTRYGPEDGLDNLNISLGRWTIMNNKIYSGSPGAYSIIDPYVKTVSQDSFCVNITSLQTDAGVRYFNPDSTLSHTEILSPGETNLTIHFGAPVFSGIEKNQLSYQLSGIDKGWQEAADRLSANYHNLPPGEYVFRVKAVNTAEHSASVTASLPFEIRPPFWRTRWFWLLWIFLVGSIIWIAMTRRIKNIRRSAALLQQQTVIRQELAEMEMMALRTQMNPHFIFNCMNIMDALVRENRKEAAQQFIQQFSRLLRLVLENSSYPLVSLHSEMEALTLYMNLEVIRNNQSFTYHLSIDPELTENNYQLSPMLLQPYVENAIVHGLKPRLLPGGMLNITIRRVDHMVMVSIEDNGIGRAESMALNEKNRMYHQPVALRLTAKRIELLERSFGTTIHVTVEDLNPGTGVTLKLPYPFTMNQKS